MMNEVLCGDCVSLIKDVKDNSIDMIITSPPYDNLRKYNGYSFDFYGLAPELYRVLKPGGVMVWVVGDSTIKGSETLTSFKQAIYLVDIGFNLHDTMIYRKHNYMPLNHNRYEQEFEYMFCFSKGKPKTFHPIKIPCKYAGEKHWANPTYHKSSDSGLVNVDNKTVNDYKLHGNIFTYTVGKVMNKGVRHPAPFPEQLVKDQIETWSVPGDTVLDPFVGSGTTAKVCTLMKRNFIAYDISEEYCKMSIDRVKDAKEIISTDYLSLKLGDVCVVFDEYSHDYTEHRIRIDSVEYDDEYKTETNPRGAHYFGKDLDYDKDEELCITNIHEGNFIHKTSI